MKSLDLVVLVGLLAIAFAVALGADKIAAKNVQQTALPAASVSEEPIAVYQLRPGRSGYVDYVYDLTPKEVDPKKKHYAVSGGALCYSQRPNPNKGVFIFCSANDGELRMDGVFIGSWDVLTPGPQERGLVLYRISEVVDPRIEVWDD